MTEQNQNPDITDDTEGHGRGNPAAADDASGLDSMDDVEGHTRKPRLDAGDEDDVEGHTRKPR